MLSGKLIPSALAVVVMGAGAFALTGARGAASVEVVDFGKTVTATRPAFDARVAPVSDARIKEFIIPITHDTIEIASGVKYEGWTFGGTVPGPVIRVREGDLVRIKVVNKSPMPHSIDFHSARIPANVAYRSFNPGDSISFEFVARDPGAYMVHCGTPPVTMHIMQGMYFAIIVDPKNGWGTRADKEFVLVQSEFYTKKDSITGAIVPDYTGAMAKQATQVVFNGRAFQYKDNPLSVDVGDRVRFFVVNAGPTFRSDFHVVGAVFDRVYPDGNPRNALERVQTQTIPAGGGAVFETVFEEGASGVGLYPFVTHSFADAEKGAVGIIKVGEPTRFAHMEH
ncbi:MAG TPA: multicopper oxidase domain-containing protein [Gemmatimonadaceae bacterium]|nr:multicopper oxidase domain-containing protein [Gemmatimonadaceae bacterium]